MPVRKIQKPTEDTLSKRQELLNYIQGYYGKNRIPPTLQEMAQQIYGHKRYAGNLSNFLVDPLIDEGFLYHISKGDEKRKVRDIMLTSPQPRECYYKRETQEERIS